MKNSKFTWKNYRQPGVPGQAYWGSREWRRYEERQKRKRRKQHPYNVEGSLTADILIFLAAFVGIGLIFGWKISLGLFILICAVALMED